MFEFVRYWIRNWRHQSTEDEWRETCNLSRMLKYVTYHALPIYLGSESPSIRGSFVQRKLRLLVCAILRPPPVLGGLDQTILTAEGYVDGKITGAELAARYSIEKESFEPVLPGDEVGTDERFQTQMLLPLMSAVSVSEICRVFPDAPDRWYPPDRCADCVRELFGNPFRADFLPLPVNLSAVQAPVFQIANDIYRNNAFHLLPILGDAVSDLWGMEGSLPAHCRSAGRHCKGCWALDFVLDACRFFATPSTSATASDR